METTLVRTAGPSLIYVLVAHARLVGSQRRNTFVSCRHRIAIVCLQYQTCQPQTVTQQISAVVSMVLPIATCRHLIQLCRTLKALRDFGKILRGGIPNRTTDTVSCIAEASSLDWMRCSFCDEKRCTSLWHLHMAFVGIQSQVRLFLASSKSESRQNRLHDLSTCW